MTDHATFGVSGTDQGDFEKSQTPKGGDLLTEKALFI